MPVLHLRGYVYSFWAIRCFCDKTGQAINDVNLPVLPWLLCMLRDSHMPIWSYYNNWLDNNYIQTHTWVKLNWRALMMQPFAIVSQCIQDGLLSSWKSNTISYELWWLLRANSHPSFWMVYAFLSPAKVCNEIYSQSFLPDKYKTTHSQSA